MSPLTIRFAGRLSTENRDRVAIATISPLVPTDAATKKEKLILSLDGGSIELKPGRYFVETWLPSGERLTDTVLYPEEQEAVLYLSEEQEALLLGAPMGIAQKAALDRSDGQEDQLLRAPLGIMPDPKPENFGGSRAIPTNEPPSVSLWLAPVVAEGDPVQAGVFLQRLTGVIQNDTATLADMESKYLQLEPGFTPFQTEQQVLYHLNHPKLSRDVPSHRGFIHFQSNSLEYLLAVPLPWDRRNSQLDLAVASRWAGTESNGFALILKNPELSTPLSYLAGGDARQAGELLDLDLMERMLQLKAANPLGAALGGYLLLVAEGETGNTERQNHPVWHDWLANLKNWFSWLPDGAVQHGWLRLSRAQSRQDVSDARLSFLEACRRGLPYFTKGLVMLVEGLRQLSRDESLLTPEERLEIHTWLDRLLPIAWRTDMSQVFLTIKLRMAKLPEGAEEN